MWNFGINIEFFYVMILADDKTDKIDDSKNIIFKSLSNFCVFFPFFVGEGGWLITCIAFDSFKERT